MPTGRTSTAAAMGVYGDIWHFGGYSTGFHNDLWLIRTIPVCPPGRIWNSPSCLNCGAGTWASPIWNATACNLCPATTYSTAISAMSNSTCIPCDNKTMPTCPAGSGLQCLPGFEPSGGKCDVCNAGTSKSAVGSSSCATCSNPFHSTPGSTSCVVYTAIGYERQSGPANVNTLATDTPPPRQYTSLQMDRNGSLWMFGGIGTGYYSDLYTYDPTITKAWKFVDGSNATNSSGRLADKPTPRGKALFHPFQNTLRYLNTNIKLLI